jgi:RNA polymerase sigma-54 factor
MVILGVKFFIYKILPLLIKMPGTELASRYIIIYTNPVEKALSMFQIHHPEIRPLTTAHLAQTMTLLSLSVEEIWQQIESELASNPALEMKEERVCPTCHRILTDKSSCPVCSRPMNTAPDEPVVFISPRDDFTPSSQRSDADSSEDQEFTPNVEDLPTYVLRQIAPELDPQDRRIAAYLLAHLDDDGFLTIDPIEVAAYYHIPSSRVENVRKMIQCSDPIGVCSRNTQEALLVQIEVLSEVHPIPDLARQVILEGLELLKRRHFKELAQELHVSISQIQSIANFIGDNLNPFPGRSHWGEARDAATSVMQVYRQPDIIINFLNEERNNPFVVEIVMPIGGTLRINPMFKNAIKLASKEERAVWKTDVERASLFVKCLQQRNHTIKRLMQSIVKLQREYILFGPKSMLPVTRVRIAEELGVHESTISRAVANKTVQLPNRKIIPLASFFDRSLNVRSVLRDLISRENAPLSDAQLVELLALQGHMVARRTVAKYRAMEGILPAHLRRTMLQFA